MYVCETKMKHKAIISIFIFFVAARVFPQEHIPLDSLLQLTMSAAEKYDGLVESYEADVYLRAYVETIKKNFLYKYARYIPKFVLCDENSDEALIETISKLKFSAPNNYVQDIKYVTGTLTSQKDLDMIPFNLININIYGETTFDESFVMPLRHNSSKYYKYSLGKIFEESKQKFYTLAFYPIYKSQALLKGTCIIEEGSWRVVNFEAEAVDIMTDYTFHITMGNESITRFLPTDFVIYKTISYLGNKVASRYLAKISYNDIVLKQSIERQKQLNISDRFKVRMDSVPIENDSLFWEKQRMIPLQSKEKEVIENFESQQMQSAAETLSDSTSNSTEFAQRIVIDSKYQYKSTQIRYSGLLNPFLIGYSSYDGISYRQKLYFDIDLKNQRNLDIKAMAGYMFKRKELLADLSFKWNYNPSHLGSLSYSIGIGNKSFSSDFIQQVQDSLNNHGLVFEDVSVKYFTDYYMRLFNDVEYKNGLMLGAGIEYHIRKSETKLDHFFRSASSDKEELDAMFDTRYIFMPFVRVSWTPEQYYRYEGRQKIPVRSKYPTFKIELAKSFKNILNSTLEFNRYEFDISQNIQFGIMKSLQYHFGGGLFTNQKTEYFADFIYFSKYNFPDNWDDGIGGNFNLLQRNLYYVSDSYLQFHVMYETPFLFLKSIPEVSKAILTERIYLSQLYTPQIHSYSEIGYGIGNRFFNIGLFGAFHKFSFNQIGVKAALAF
ncbi:MAG: hypothetical protein PWQ81_438 [Bacteroidota bacterium]|nr:hypothetical protein [Bacteroidota bacterium]